MNISYFVLIQIGKTAEIVLALNPQPDRLNLVVPVVRED